MKPDTLRARLVEDGPLLGDDVSGMLIGLGVWLLLLVAAPLAVLVLAAGLLSIELPRAPPRRAPRAHPVRWRHPLDRRDEDSCWRRMELVLPGRFTDGPDFWPHV